MICWAFCFAADMLAGDVDRADPKNERVMLRSGVKIEEAMVAVFWGVVVPCSDCCGKGKKARRVRPLDIYERRRDSM